MPIPIGLIIALAGLAAQTAGAARNRNRGGQGQALIPPDLVGFRGEQLALLRSFLEPGGQGFSNFFGQLGMPQNELQRQAAGGISQFLNQPAPETRAFDISRPILEGMLTGTGPQFERDISLANQQGGRFGSANAILRGEALRNLFNLRNQTATTLGTLAGQAGNAPFGRLLAAGQFGGGLAQQGDVETQRRLQMLMSLFGLGQQTAFNLPVTQQGPGALETFGQGGMNLGMLLALLPSLLGSGSGGGTSPTPTAPPPATSGWV